MIGRLLAASIGLLVAGVPGMLVGLTVLWARSLWQKRSPQTPQRRLVMMLLLVELRSGLSVLAALQATAKQLPDYEMLRRVARVATVAGLTASISESDDNIRPVLAQLARAQRSGSSLTSAVRRMIDQDLAAQRSERLTSARTLPVRLMIPVTLLMLPGLVLLLYAPALIRTFGQLTGSWP